MGPLQHAGRRRPAVAPRGLCAVLACAPSLAGAHSFVQPYTLPVPFGLYLYGGAATLVLTFVLLAWFLRVPSLGGLAAGNSAALRLAPRKLPGWLVDALRAFAVALLVLVIGAGFFGTRDPDANIAMTLFWVVFVLGLMYATAFVGDLYAFVNPWKTIAEWLGLQGQGSVPRHRYPAWLGYWPALLFYVALIWLELFALPKPVSLATSLVVYSLVTFAGIWVYGERAWLRYAETFSVLFRLVGLLAPIEYGTTAHDGSLQMRTRLPLSGVLAAEPERLSLVVFVLFMLSSTTFDGMHETLVWMNVFWKYILTALQPLWGGDLLGSQRMLERWYVVFQRLGLVLSPFFYLAIYFIVIAGVKAVTRTTLSLGNLALAFIYSVLPIALVYNVAHYWTLLLIQVPKLPYLFSDPFGRGWTLPALGRLPAEPPPLDMAPIWNTEVTLIVAGHLVAVYLAHRIALRTFPTRREAIVSQIPMLVLMVAYTVIGLWVISQPLALER